MCGKTRYRITAAPLSLADCHCVDCRRASAAAFVTWGTVPREALTIVRGDVKVVAHAERLRSFAACCGTPLFFADDAEAPMVEFTVASLDDPAPFGPTRAIWMEDRLPWVVVDPRLAVYRRESSGG